MDFLSNIVNLPLLNNNPVDFDYGKSLGGALVPNSISSFRIDNLIPNATGFTALLNRSVDVSNINLYDGSDQGFDLPDVTLVGSDNEIVRGSLVYDNYDRMVHFVKTNGLLEADTYRVTFHSRFDGWVDKNGEFLDGDANGSPGGDYVSSFTINPTGARVLSLPNFSRGMNQSIDIPATGMGLPVVIDNAAGIQSIELELAFNPNMLNITGVNLGSGLPSNWQISNQLVTPGRIRVNLSGSEVLSSDIKTLFTLSGNVPGNAPYRGAHVISFAATRVNNGAISAIGDSGVHVVSYIGDATGNQSYSSLDSALLSRVVVGLDTGFDAYPSIDPVIIGDASGNGFLSGLDASFIARKIVGLFQPEIPNIPVVMAVSNFGIKVVDGVLLLSDSDSSDLF